MLTTPTTTHEVLNQARRWRAATSSRTTPRCARRSSARAAAGRASACARPAPCWGGEPMRWGVEANEHPPVLHTHDRFGHRRDEVEFHPRWHALMRRAVEQELHALPWRNDAAGRPRRARRATAAADQAEAGFGCPITMTFAPCRRCARSPTLAAEWVPRLTRRVRPELRGRASRRAVRHGDDREAGRLGCARQHHARACRRGDGWCELTGHKWFCSRADVRRSSSSSPRPTRA